MSFVSSPLKRLKYFKVEDIDIREAKELFASSVNKIIPLVTR